MSLREERGREAVLHRVDDPHGLVPVVDRDDRGHRAEDLLLRDARIGLDLGEDGRLEEAALAEIPVACRLAADDEVGLVAADGGIRRDALDGVSLMTGPTSVLSSRPSPSTSFATRCWSRWTKSSWIARCTISREAAVQRWPLVPNADHTTLSRARSRSASSQTTIGFLPPSSRLTRLRVFAARVLISTPVSVWPVKLMTLTSGWSTIALPTSPPEPVTTLTTPSRQPALDEQLHEADEAGRRVGRGLDDGRVAADQRREQLPGRDGDREVPRRDDADHADRPADGHRELVGHLGRHGLAEQAAALAGHVVGDVDRLLHVAARLGQHLAHLARHEASRALPCARPAGGRCGTGSRRASAPASRSSCAKARCAARDGGVDVRRAGGGELADDLVVVRRAGAGEGGARRGGLPVAADQVLVRLGHVGISLLRCARATRRVRIDRFYRRRRPAGIPGRAGTFAPWASAPGCAEHGPQLKNRRGGILLITITGLK